MRFTVSSTALSSKLNALSRVINSKNSLPILADFVFDINNGMLQLTASDSENVMTTQLELTDVDGYGRFAVGNHDLLEAVKGFSEQPITFDIDQQANIAKISYQNGLFSLPVESADEFPMAQKVSEGAIGQRGCNRDCHPQFTVSREHQSHAICYCSRRVAPGDERYLFRPYNRVPGLGCQRWPQAGTQQNSDHS